MPDERIEVPLLNAMSTWALRPEALARIRAAMLGQAVETDPPREAAARTAIQGAVAVIPLQGVIQPRPSLLSILFGGGGGLNSFRQQFREVLASDDVGSIVLNVDSPGGSTDLIEETAAEIRAARGQKPIIAVANTMAASAAYWIASAADELVVTPSGEVGSIGVFALHEEFSKMDEQLGITTTMIRAGKYKAEANPYEPLTEEAKQALQEMVDEFYGMFVAGVAKGREVTAAVVKRDFGQGRMVSAKRAVEAGMADRVATLEETVAQLAGVSRPRRKADADGARRSHQAHDTRALRLARERRL